MFELNPDQSATGVANVLVNRSAEDVFHFIGVDFFRNYPRWSPELQECELLTDPPLQLNSLIRQVRIDQGHRSETVFRVTVYDPGKKLVFEGVSDAFRCSYDICENPATRLTRLTFTVELLELEFYMLPFAKIIRAAVRNGAKRTVQNLKFLLER